MIRKMLIFDESQYCGHRYNGRCEHPSYPGSDYNGIDDNRCPSGIALWCPLPDATQPDNAPDTKSRAGD